MDSTYRRDEFNIEEDVSTQKMKPIEMEPGGLGGKPSPEEAVVASLISNIPPKWLWL